ncbi:9129_t:CDS:2 [Entrophospora sp. SA101]|nr:9129_t:CDS:2 [Entrophospora sp. SA101]
MATRKLVIVTIFCQLLILLLGSTVSIDAAAIKQAVPDTTTDSLSTSLNATETATTIDNKKVPKVTETAIKPNTKGKKKPNKNAPVPIRTSTSALTPTPAVNTTGTSTQIAVINTSTTIISSSTGKLPKSKSTSTLAASTSKLSTDATSSVDVSTRTVVEKNPSYVTDVNVVVVKKPGDGGNQEQYSEDNFNGGSRKTVYTTGLMTALSNFLKWNINLSTKEQSLSSSVLADPKPNAFRTPGPSGLCKEKGELKKLGLRESNGTQIRTGFCSSQIQGEVPNVSKMTSTIIVFPKNAGTVIAGKNFTAVVKVKNLATGQFSDPVDDYYDRPQQLNNKGVILGHSHISIQKLNGNNVPDATVFAFFKGLNLPAEGGALTQVVSLPAPGLYRMCTMSSSFTHQPVVMPVAQRGPQDDCIRFRAIRKR